MKKISSLFCLITLSALLSACASTMSPREPKDAMIDSALEVAISGNEAIMRQPDQVPPEVSEALLPPIELPVVGSQITVIEERFDISVRRAQARDFFMGLVEGTALNMVVHPDVEGRISLDLKSVTIDEVMDTVREVYGFEFKKRSGGYWVLPARLQTRIFHVNYLNVRRSGNSQTRVSSGQVSENISNSDSTSVNTVSSSQIETVSESDFWRELSAAIKAILGEKDSRKVVITPHTGIIVVRAMPRELREIGDFLETTQSVIQRQVILEAKILEVSLSDGFQSGINWAALSTSGTDSVLLGQTGGGSLFSGSSISEIAGNTGVLDPSALSQVQGTTTSAFGGAFSLAVNTGDFTSFIELLKTQGDVQVLSSPRVSTVNNQKAVIKVGSDEFFVTKISSTTSSSGSSTTTTPDITLTPFFSGIALDVTPQIDTNGNVILHIHPSVSEVEDQTKNITVGGLSQSLPLAFSSVRESDSIVRAKSGQVIVLGGLMTNQVKDKDASTPGLSDIPLVGAMFRHAKKINSKSELVILLRPVVIGSGQVWNDELSGSRERIKALRAGER